MRAFVTGGTGFIGVPLIRALLERGNDVTLLARNVERARGLFREAGKGLAELEVIRGDLDGSPELPVHVRSAMRGCEVAFHVAGRICYDRHDRERSFRVNRDGTRAICRAAEEAGIRRLVHTSSIVTIGISWSPDQSLGEANEYNASDLRLAYFDSKRAAEDEVRRAVSRGLDAVIVNPGTVAGSPKDSGPSGNVLRALNTLIRLPFALPGGNCWVDVRDVVEGHLLALERGTPGARYILATENISNAEIARRLRHLLGREARAFMLPPSAVRLLARVTRSQQITRASGFYLYMDSTKARQDLGWNPRSPWGAIEAMAAHSPPDLSPG